MAQLKVKYKPQKVWIGAMALSGGTILTDYCWMTDARTTGSQLTLRPNITLDAQGSPPYCLFVNTPSPFAFHGYNCASGKNQTALCEFGKEEHTSSTQDLDSEMVF